MIGVIDKGKGDFMDNSSAPQGNQFNIQPICDTAAIMTGMVCGTILIDRHFDEIKDALTSLFGRVQTFAINCKGFSLVLEPMKEPKVLPEAKK